jgi:dTDP-4-dehydrorhamnose reductase
MTLEVIDRRLTGIFHLCGATRINRLNFAQSIAKTFDLDSGLIDPVKSSDFTWPAKRPMDSSLDTSKAQQLLKAKPYELDLALERLKKELSS